VGFRNIRFQFTQASGERVWDTVMWEENIIRRMATAPGRLGMIGALALWLLFTGVGSPPLAAESAVPSSPEVSGGSGQQLLRYTLPPAELRKAYALYRIDVSLYLVLTVYGFLVLYLMLRSGFSRKLRDVACKLSRRRLVQAAVVMSAFVLLLQLSELPFDLYRHHVSLQYGLSVQHWPSWFGDWSKGLLLGFIDATVLGWILYAVLRRSPHRWWFYFWLAAVPIALLVVFVQPVAIDPLFNRFVPLTENHGDLVQAIERVVHRAGMDIPRSRMFEMKASEKTTTLNAYVTGFGATKRVVVWDTTMRQLTTPETLFVFGHEMGHYVLDHIWKGLALALMLVLGCLYVVYRLADWLVVRQGEAWGISGVSDWASVPLLSLIFSVLLFLLTPVFNAGSRYYEHQADIYGLEVIHGIVPDEHMAAARAFQILGERSLDYPYVGRLAQFWLWDHPTIADRVIFVQSYDPWSEGKPPEFVK
jgi:Zn-dependent protease with chaperone function